MTYVVWDIIIVCGEAVVKFARRKEVWWFASKALLPLADTSGVVAVMPEAW